ncbi:MAG TPA: hypothetical protein DCG73_18650 [Morganella sp. (in: Bacteria)]|nr:hypothetical protein [Morganella sp. (in: enterobacteria)]
MRLLKKRLTTGKRDEKGKNRDKKALETDDDTYKQQLLIKNRENRTKSSDNQKYHCFIILL